MSVADQGQTDDTAQRLTRLEEALSHQALTIEILDGLVREQADRIARLEARVARLMERAADAEAAAGSHVFTDAPPPHY